MSKDFYGLPTVSLENAYLRIDALAQAGPRLVRAFIHGISENQFAELPGLKIETPLGDFSMQGGHRLWHAPEAIPRTYVSDDHGLVVIDQGDGLILRGPVESFTNIRKTIEIHLLPNRAGLKVIHTLTNTGPWPVELACWGITQLPLGGVAVLPQPSNPSDSKSLLPNRSLVLWPYSRWSDPRLHLHDDYILIKGEAQIPALKVGYANNRGWIGYLRNGVFFIKHFDPAPSLPHPDFGCSSEVYVNHLFIEVETLGSLLHLQPDQSTTLTETWEFFPELAHFPISHNGVRSLVKHLGLS